jgi:DNA-binding MarR family transcriptional regulator
VAPVFSDGSGAAAAEVSSVVAPITTTRPELLDDGNDAHFRELVHDLIALGARHQEIRAGHASYIGLSASQYTVLIAAAHLERDGSVLIKEIADHLRVTPTYVSMETKALAKKGLLIKRRSEEDSRVTELVLTPEGRDALSRLSAVQTRVNDVQFGDITGDEFQELRRLVRAMISNSDRALALQAQMRAAAQFEDLEAAGRETATR